MAEHPVSIESTTPSPEVSPNISKVRQAVLRDSQQVRKEVKFRIINDEHTGEYHHDSLVIKTWKKRKDHCEESSKHTISLDSREEIESLSTFLIAVLQGATGSGIFVAVNADNFAEHERLQDLINSSSKSGQANALVSVLQKASEDPQLFEVVLERARVDPELFSETATKLNLAAFKSAVAELEDLIAAPNSTEQQFQSHLERHPWMFGSEYSKLLDRRRWTRDENLDYVVRRTTDGYIEVIEIKTPLNGSNLFNEDKSHKSFYASAELSKVIGQVQNYICELDTNREMIQRKDGEDTNKIRAKIIIGRDGDENQAKALRTFNGHLHRIEVITFDQLLNIAKCVTSHLEQSLLPQSDGLA
jgi:hypothetical protein